MRPFSGAEVTRRLAGLESGGGGCCGTCGPGSGDDIAARLRSRENTRRVGGGTNWEGIWQDVGRAYKGADAV